MSELVDLDLRCPHCGGEITAHFAEWQQDAPLADTVLVCPFCSREWRAGVPARLLFVARRQPNSGLHH